MYFKSQVWSRSGSIGADETFMLFSLSVWFSLGSQKLEDPVPPQHLTEPDTFNWATYLLTYFLPMVLLKCEFTLSAWVLPPNSAYHRRYEHKVMPRQTANLIRKSYHKSGKFRTECFPVCGTFHLQSILPQGQLPPRSISEASFRR